MYIMVVEEFCELREIGMNVYIPGSVLKWQIIRRYCRGWAIYFNGVKIHEVLKEEGKNIEEESQNILKWFLDLGIEVRLETKE